MSGLIEATDTLRLPEALDLQAAPSLAQAFLDRRGRDLQVDGADVQRLGGQCLQVLLAAQAAWTADTRRLRIVNPSPGLLSALTLLGVDPASALLEQEHLS